MAWTKGQSGNPRGRAAEKPFAGALRIEIKAAAEEHQKLRAIAAVNTPEQITITSVRETRERWGW
jgi:hypothetical protein